MGMNPKTCSCPSTNGDDVKIALALTTVAIDKLEQLLGTSDPLVVRLRQQTARVAAR